MKLSPRSGKVAGGLKSAITGIPLAWFGQINMVFIKLTSAAPQQDSRHGLKQNLYIEPKALRFDVLDIQLDLLGKIDRGATPDLPEAGQSWSDFEPPAVRSRV